MAVTQQSDTHGRQEKLTEVLLRLELEDLPKYLLNKVFLAEKLWEDGQEKDARRIARSVESASKRHLKWTARVPA